MKPKTEPAKMLMVLGLMQTERPKASIAEIAGICPLKRVASLCSCSALPMALQLNRTEQMLHHLRDCSASHSLHVCSNALIRW